MMDFAAIKAADKLLGIPDPGQSATALNAQTMAMQSDVALADARAVILPTGEYGALVLLSGSRDFLSNPKQLVISAITAVAMFNSDQIIQAADTTTWNAMQSMLNSFVTAGIVSAPSRDAILALRMQTIPKWPPLDAGIIQTSRGQP